MIFSAKNEKGVPTWKLVITDQKTVTRRLKPEPVGAIRSVQPGRCKKSVCKIRILRCETHDEAADRLSKEGVEKHMKRRVRLNSLGDFLSLISNIALESWDEEAKREGFSSHMYLWSWFYIHKIEIKDTYRIEFERIKDDET